MAPRQKKLIVALLTSPFLLLYAGLCLWIYDLLPQNRILELVYFIFVGTVWAFPLKPVMLWMNREPEPKA